MQNKQDIWNAVYLGATKECERREFAGEISGNGHHMAQQITKRVEDDLASRPGLEQAHVLDAVRKVAYTEARARDKGDLDTATARSVLMAEVIVGNVRELLEGRNVFREKKVTWWQRLFH